jgi:2-hydroxychromene-2-carboxylate isomerase
MADPRVSLPLSDVQAVFFYDLGSPACYLAAERIMSELGSVPEWEPVLESSLAAITREVDRSAIERGAQEQGLQPVRWPVSWPPNSAQVMLAASYAKRIGRGVAFSLAAFRQAFAGGRDLSDLDTILISGAACEIHPAALLKGIELRSTHQALDAAAARARRAGVTCLPAVSIAGRVFEGIDAIEQTTQAAVGER